MLKALIGTVLIVALFNLFFYPLFLGIGISLFVLITAIFGILTRNKDSKNLDLAILSTILSVLFAFLLSYRGNGIIQALDLLLSAFFATAALIFYKNENRFEFSIPHFLLSPFLTLHSYFISLGNLFIKPPSSEEKTNKTLASILKGIFLTLPLLVVLLLLLTNSDPIYSKFVGDFFKDIWVRLILSVLIFVIYFPLGVITSTKFFSAKVSNSNFTSHKSYELIILLGSISALFLTFILVQFKYLFSNLGERELNELGIKSLTYSEYINKGFFELIVVTGIVSLVLIYVLNIIHRLPEKSQLLTKIFACLLTIETFLIVLSDFRRLDLYQVAHGLTRARVFGFSFLVWLSLILLIFLVSFLYQLKNKVFFYSTIIASLIVLLTINFLNIDALIATKYKPSVNGETDYLYISSLSTDAVKGWDESLLDSKSLIDQLDYKTEITSDEQRKFFYVEKTFNAIKYKTDVLKDKYNNESEFKQRHKKDFREGEDFFSDPYNQNIRSWKSFNLTEFQAYQYIKNNPAYSNLNDYKEKLIRINSRLSNITTPPLDRDTSPPLVR